MGNNYGCQINQGHLRNAPGRKVGLADSKVGLADLGSARAARAVLSQLSRLVSQLSQLLSQLSRLVNQLSRLWTGNWFSNSLMFASTHRSCFILRAITKCWPYEFIHINMHKRNKIFWLFIIGKHSNLITLHNIKIHANDQNKELRDDHTYHEINSR